MHPSLRQNSVIRLYSKLFKNWDKVSFLSFSQVSSPSNADIIFTWGEILEGPQLVGYTYLNCTGNTITSAVIIFSMYHTWTVNSNDYNLSYVALHELGHALGLEHVSNTNALMYSMYGSF
jgi:predicted Zn-dependent protease